MIVETLCFLTIPKDVVNQPFIFRLKKRFDVVPNIFRAEVNEDEGWMILKLRGEEENLRRSILELRCLGIHVEEGQEEILNKKQAEKLVAVRFRLLIPGDQVGQPVINDLLDHCGVVTNLKKARISQSEAWVDLEISGPSREVDKATDFLKARNITVNAIEGDIIE